jgi:hypothetical protein
MGPVTTSLAALVDCHACNRDDSRAADVRSDAAPRDVHRHLIPLHLLALDAVGRWVSRSVLPRAERFRPNIVRKSSPIRIANSAMPSRLLAMHFCLMLYFRLCHLLILGG